MFKIIVIVVLVAVVAILIYAVTQPDTFSYERKIRINAPAEKIFPYINDFKHWLAWSPYEKKDPGMKRSYGATTIGKGASYEWDGNKDIGAGRMDITDVTDPTRIVIRLEFFRPFKTVNSAVFTLQSVAGGTEVRWVMAGPANIVSKIMGLFFDMDKMIGKDFEDGLAALKNLAENGG